MVSFGTICKAVATGVVGIIASMMTVHYLLSAIEDYKPLGEMVPIGDDIYVHVRCVGPVTKDNIVVLLESGVVGSTEDYYVIQNMLAAKGIRSCSYDRQGHGHSNSTQPTSDVVSLKRFSEDLEKALRGSKQLDYAKTKFVLVAWSFGGLGGRYFQHTHDNVKALVLLDAATEDLEQFLPGVFDMFETIMGACSNVLAPSGLLRTLAFLGQHPFQPVLRTFPDEIRGAATAMVVRRSTFATAAHEIKSLTAMQNELAGIHKPSKIPVFIALAPAHKDDFISEEKAVQERYDRMEAALRKMAEQFYGQSKIVTLEDVDHFLPHHRPAECAQLIVEAVQAVSK